MNLWRQDKGQTACAKAFVDVLQTGGVSPIPFDEIVEVSRLSIELAANSKQQTTNSYQSSDNCLEFVLRFV